MKKPPSPVRRRATSACSAVFLSATLLGGFARPVRAQLNTSSCTTNRIGDAAVWGAGGALLVLLPRLEGLKGSVRSEVPLAILGAGLLAPHGFVAGDRSEACRAARRGQVMNAPPLPAEYPTDARRIAVDEFVPVSAREWFAVAHAATDSTKHQHLIHAVGFDEWSDATPPELRRTNTLRVLESSGTVWSWSGSGASGGTADSTASFYKTEDGGRSWVADSAVRPAAAFARVHEVVARCPSATVGPRALLGWPPGFRFRFVCDESGVLPHAQTSSDSGATWTDHAAPLASGPHDPQAWLPVLIDTDDWGFVAWRLAVLTTDGGEHWHMREGRLAGAAALVARTGPFRRVTFVNPLVGFALGRAGDEVPLWQTTDGGTIWHPIELRLP